MSLKACVTSAGFEDYPRKGFFYAQNMNVQKEEKNQTPKKTGETQITDGTDTTEKQGKDALTFFRLTAPNSINHVPRYLFEQVKDLDEGAIDRLYQYSSSVLTVVVPSEQGLVRIPNDLVWIAVLQDEGHKIKGFLWLDFDIIEQYIFVQLLTVDKEYQFGDILEKSMDYIMNLDIPDVFKKRIEWATTRPKAFERIGWKRAERVLMRRTNG